MIKLKSILSEGYAWEREPGKPLPTLEQTTAAYAAKQASIEESENVKPDYIDLDGDGDEEESMRDAAEDAKEEQQDVHEAFANRLRGNLHGSEFILTETFKK